MIRTSTFSSVSCPTGRIEPSCKARNSFACNAIGISPISSSNKLPPLASCNRPLRDFLAPVNEPAEWPKNSLSNNSCGIPAQLTAKKGPSARSLSACRALATSSLPVPLSPLISTGPCARPITLICSNRLRIASLRPNI